MTLYMCYRVRWRAAGSYRKRSSFVIELLKSIRTSTPAGSIRYNMGDYQERSADFNEALRLQPDYADATANGVLSTFPRRLSESARRFQ